MIIIIKEGDGRSSEKMDHDDMSSFYDDGDRESYKDVSGGRSYENMEEEEDEIPKMITT